MERAKVCETLPQELTDQGQETLAPRCPACGGPLLLLRSFWNCPRCHFRVCQDCDGGPGEEY